MRPAFSATAAFAAAMTFATTGYWRGAARDTRPASPSITTCRWAIRLASRAGNAWCRVLRARLTNRKSSARTCPATAVDAEVLLALPIFKNVSGTFLELNRNAVVERHFRAGDIICREGDFGATAFYILEGKADVYLSSPIAHVKTEGSTQGFFSKLQSLLATARTSSAEMTRRHASFHSHRCIGRSSLRQSDRRTRSRANCSAR